MVSRRSFVFARAGFGKSNLNKLLFSTLYKATPTVRKRGDRDVPVGTVIFDPDGEYFWPDDKAPWSLRRAVARGQARRFHVKKKPQRLLPVVCRGWNQIGRSTVEAFGRNRDCARTGATGTTECPQAARPRHLALGALGQLD